MSPKKRMLVLSVVAIISLCANAAEFVWTGENFLKPVIFTVLSY